MINITTEWHGHDLDSALDLRIQTSTGHHFDRINCSECTADEIVAMVIEKIQMRLNNENQDRMFVMGQSGG
tara:strand:- start:331 stop:543 length:213 start_codon:yes stop_codon:yes gene_type:complete